VNTDEREEALSRLGGPSKIEKLTEKLESLQSELHQLKSEHQETVDKLDAARKHIKANTLKAGAQVWLGGTPGLCWYSEIGNQEHPSGTVTIEGIGHDWCVIRQDSLPPVLFASTPDILEHLADAIYV
jgi:hypothetical protein